MPEFVDDRARELGDMIVEAREAAGLLQYQLAKIADVPQGYLSQIERGLKRPSLETLQKLRGALGVNRREFMSWVDLFKPEREPNGDAA